MTPMDITEPHPTMAPKSITDPYYLSEHRRIWVEAHNMYRETYGERAPNITKLTDDILMDCSEVATHPYYWYWILVWVTRALRPYIADHKMKTIESALAESPHRFSNTPTVHENVNLLKELYRRAVSCTTARRLAVIMYVIKGSADITVSLKRKVSTIL